ncbi:MAG TPA: alpha/beta hydrolase domain-containing protein [Terriglobales bacterium]|nr:alpha/beta hydrolase domain-containing protein [Terriglobales bacterium]
MSVNKKMILVLGMAFLAMQCAFGQAKKDDGTGIRRIVITKTEPAFGGTSFGSAGPYEFLIGKAYGELDPKASNNAGIVNLDNVAVNARGHVEYTVDVTILKPVDINKGNGRLIYDVINRGHEKALSDLNLSKFSSIGPADVKDPATGYIMKRGYTVAWSGWEAEDSSETSRPGLLKAKFPVAMKDGKPITGITREEVSNVPAGAPVTKLLTYPAATTDQSAATLTVRQLERDPRKPLPASSWKYVDAKHIAITAAPGMDREAIYEFIYPATDAVVEGMAFPAVRDFVEFARYAEKDSTGTPNPLHTATPFKAVLAVGISQSGRFLRDMVYLGFNADSTGKKVFDGALSAVSGSRKTNINTQFAQPGRFSRQHEDHDFAGDQFPFTYATTKDPISGKTDGIQIKCSKNNTCPKFMHIDTTTDVYQGRVSLVFTDPSGKDVALPENVRMYLPTGVPHESDLIDPGLGTPERGTCERPKSPLQYRHYVRALFTALDAWVTEGVAPPPSRHPSFKDHTLVTVEEAGKTWPTIPGFPFSPLINRLRLMDYSSEPPKAVGGEYPVFVPRNNADGNPIGGIEPPEITVPIGTYSGQNIRAEGFAQGDLCGLNGSYVPFAITKKERMETKDTRLSLEERYKSPEEFSAKRKAATDKMVKERLLLPEDAASIAAVPLPKASAMAEMKH